MGKLHSELCPKSELSRDAFEELTGALARAGLIRLTEAVFEKDGKQIPFRKANLTRDAEYVGDDTPLDLRIKDTRAAERKGRTKTRQKKKVKPAAKVNARTVDVLRAWRLTLAKRHGVPAFRIMTDKVLSAIASDRPRTAAELLAVPGMGIHSVEKYGAQIYRILNETRD